MDIKNPESRCPDAANKGGRPRISFFEKSNRAQRRDAAKLSQGDNVNLMLRAASTAARKRSRLSGCLKKLWTQLNRSFKNQKNCLPTKRKTGQIFR